MVVGGRGGGSTAASSCYSIVVRYLLPACYVFHRTSSASRQSSTTDCTLMSCRSNIELPVAQQGAAMWRYHLRAQHYSCGLDCCVIEFNALLARHHNRMYMWIPVGLHLPEDVRFKYIECAAHRMTSYLLCPSHNKLYIRRMMSGVWRDWKAHACRMVSGAA
jgi:hypothetical protein